MNCSKCRKAYVSVNLDVDEEGAIQPRLIRWKDGLIFQIDQFKCFVVEAAISSSWRWDKIMSSCPPLLRQTTYHLHERGTTPFL